MILYYIKSENGWNCMNDHAYANTMPDSYNSSFLD